MTSHESLPAAAIFDMDGVLVNSNPFHLQKWIDFLRAHRIPFNLDELPKRVLGLRNDTTFRHFFGPRLSEEEIYCLNEELEEGFRRVFRPHAKPLPGVQALIVECHQAGLLMAVASSAIAKNVEFIVDALGFRPYFRCLVAGNEVTHPKPHPETYAKAAAKLGVAAPTCVAFEDSFVGVEAAKNAGMKCVAVASTFPLAELREHAGADLAVQSFEEVSLARLRKLFDAPTPG